jgi:hypothetical protein
MTAADGSALLCRGHHWVIELWRRGFAFSSRSARDVLCRDYRNLLRVNHRRDMHPNMLLLGSDGPGSSCGYYDIGEPAVEELLN